MIEKLHRLAHAIRILRLPSIALGIICLASLCVIIFVSQSHEGDRYIIPSLIGLLWAMSTYAFIATFVSVPTRAEKPLRFFSRLKQRLLRGWYWVISIVFLATTGVVILITFRMASIWWRDYGIN